MAADAPEAGSARRAGLLESLRNLISGVIGIAQTRLELLATELEEERVRLGRVLLLGAIAFVAAALGMLAVTLFVIFLFWETHRVLAAGLLAAGYFTVAVAFGLAAKRGASGKSRLFSGSIAELAKDRDRLTPR